VTGQELREAGLKVTSPRLKILEVLETNNERHMSAEAVYKALIESGEEFGLATVYRVLTQFESAGLVARHNFEGGTAVFELTDRTHHDHMVCLKTGKVISRSNEPKNPAFQIIVREKKVAQDTTWAFLNLPPHFGRKSMLAFKIARIDFVGAPPILADTTHASPPSAAAAGTKP